MTEAEAQKWEEEREWRQERAAKLKQSLLEQYRQRGQDVPEVLLAGSSSSSSGSGQQPGAAVAEGGATS